jgi:hypothetical protein
MSAIVESIEIARPPQEVFGYISDPTRRPRTRLSTEIDPEGFGPGKALAILARRDARKVLPVNGEHLKQRLEGPSAG